MNTTSSRLPRQLVSRRHFLSVGAVAGAGLTLTACGAGTSLGSVFSGTPEPNDQLLELARGLKAEQKNFQEKDVAGWPEFFGGQYDLIIKEVRRQCGTDSDGNGPAECTEEIERTANTAEDPSAPLNKLFAEALHNDGRDLNKTQREQLGTQNSLVAGLWAAYNAAQNPEPKRGAHPKVVSDEVVANFAKAEAVGEDFSSLLTLTYGAIYASGVALAKDSGATGARSHIMVLADQLRALRDMTIDILQAFKLDVPTPEVGYTQGDADSQKAAAEYLYPAIPPITVALRRIAGLASSDPAVDFATEWLKATATGEAALEKLQGTDPLATPLRG